MKGIGRFGGVIANPWQSATGRGGRLRTGLRWLLLVVLPAFFVGNAIGATDEEGPVIVYSELCPSCSLEAPFFTLKLYRDGRVVYDGPLLVDTAIPFTADVLEKGKRETNIPAEDVRRWVEMLMAAKFFLLDSSHIDKGCYERWDRALTLTINQQSYTVRWFWCLNKDFPRVLHDVGWQIETRVNPRQWIKKLPYEQSPYRPKPRKPQ